MAKVAKVKETRWLADLQRKNGHVQETIKTAKAKEDLSPYMPNSHMQEEPLLLYGQEIARIWLSNNDPVTPEKLKEFIEKAIRKGKADGYTKTRVENRTRPGDDNNLEEDYIFIVGSRLETETERQRRIDNLWSKWAMELDDHQRRTGFYESPKGQAMIKELRRRYKGRFK